MKAHTLAILASTALLPTLAFAQTQPAQPTAPAQPSAQTQTAQPGAPSAAEFVTKAANSSLFEIQSSQSALQKSQNNQVRDFAQKMIQDHTKASDQLKAAAQGQTVPTAPDAEHAQMLQQLNGANGGDFDRRYVQLQLTGHQEAVALFDQYAQNGDNPQLKQFAQQALPDLREHLQMAQQLRSALPPAQTAQTSGQAPAQGQAASASGTMSAGNWMTQPQPGQWRASKLEGLDVYNQNNEKIGDIDELILDNSGKIQAVVIGVGGFLGIGERNVAVPFDQIKFVNEPRAGVAVNNPNAPATPVAPGTATTATNNTTVNTANAPTTTGTATTTRTDNANRDVPDHAILTVNMTKDQLKAAPEFKYNR